VTRVTAIACLLLALPSAGPAADSTKPDVPARAARFYAAGLELPLLELRRGAQLLDTCATKIRRACSKEQRQLAATHRATALLDELTLFPQRDSGIVSARNAAELKQQIAASGAALMRAARDYDLVLFARYGAALRVCTDDDGVGYREPLDALIAVDLRQFLGLEGAEYDRARDTIAARQAQEIDALRALPPDTCESVLTLGLLMMEFMNGKLEPWTRENQRQRQTDPRFKFDAAVKPVKPPPAEVAPTRDVALSVAGNFVTLVATELQLRVFPETAPRIKAIAEAEGIHEVG
jgi:hypothetical protein